MKHSKDNNQVTDEFIPSKPWTKNSCPKRILAIRLQAMGDTVITLPYLQHLRESLHPDTRLDFLTRKECEGIPRSVALFDKVFAIAGERNFKKQFIYTLLLLPKLLFQRYDVIIDLQNNLLSRMVVKVIRPKAWSVFDKYSPRAAGERTRLTIEAVGLGLIEMKNGFRLKKNFNPLAILNQNGWDGKSDLVVLNPAAAFPTRNWPLENFVAFTKLWLNHFPDTQFLVLGTSFIEEKARYFQQTLNGRLINLVNKTNPAEAFSILQSVKLVLSEDSGLMHMAWVSGIPTIALFGGTRSDWARPLGKHSFFLDSSDLPCGNCMLETCRFGDVHCMTRIRPVQVFDQAILLLKKLEIASVSSQYA